MSSPLDRAMLASRYILAVFYVGLALALLLYAVRFAWKLWKYALGIFEMEDNDYLLGLLYLLDSALVASLVVMVAVSSYDSMVAPLNEASADGAKPERLDWIGSIDVGNLKIKLATAIIAISSIHLLQVFLKADNYSDRAIGWGLWIHGAFLVGGLCLALMDKLEGTTKAMKKGLE